MISPDVAAAVTRLRREGVLSAEQTLLFGRVARGELVSLSPAIQALLYIGVVALTTGAGVLFKDRLIEEGYNPSYGARPLRRAIMRLLEDSLAEEILSGRVRDGDTATVDVDETGTVKILSGTTPPPEETRELVGAGVDLDKG